MSNIPGTPNLLFVVDRDYYTCDSTEVVLDVSLENALTLREATIEFEFRAEAQCSCLPTGDIHENPCVYHDGTGFLEVSDFRVVGSRK